MWDWVDELIHDVRFAFRLTRRSPGFSLVVVLVLALGIGGNTAIFALMDTLFFRELPLREPDRVLRLLDTRRSPDGQTSSSQMSSPHVAALQQSSDLFEGIVALHDESLTLTDGETPERVSVIYRSSGWGATLGVAPPLGRDFTSAEQTQGLGSGVALISYSLWQRHFGKSGSVLGRPLQIDGQPFRVVGVMPQGFNFPYDGEVWVPFVVNPRDLGTQFAVFARIKRGVGKEQVQQLLRSATSRINEQYPEYSLGYFVSSITLRENLVYSQAGMIFALLCVVAFLLLLACVNVATLLLVRSIARNREFAIRAALGASRRRLLQSRVAESLLLAILGGVCGLLLASWLGVYTAQLLPSNFSEQLGLSRARIDSRVLLFALFTSQISALVAGTVSAVAGKRNESFDVLKEAGRSGGGAGRQSKRLLNVLAYAEVALAMILLAGAGIMLENLHRLQRQDLGFNPQHVLTLKFSPSTTSYPPGPQRAILVQRILEEVRNLPGVEAVGTTTVNPLGPATWVKPVLFDQSSRTEGFNVNHRLVSPGLLEAIGVPLRKGRGFTEADRDNAEPVVIVSEQMARRFWPGKEALGRRVRMATATSPWLTVVGVVGNVRDAADAGTLPLDTWYLPFEQHAADPIDDLYLMVRSRDAQEDLVAGIRKAFGRVDKSIALFDISAMDQYYSESLGRERVGTRVMGSFAAFGLLLAAIGVYGVIAFITAERKKEFGLRMALGADRKDILGLVLRQGLQLAIMGLAIGSIACAALNRVLASMLSQVQPFEISPIAAAAMSLVIVALVACYLPARGASKLNPNTALNHE